MKEKFIFATGNQHKLDEVSAMLAQHWLQLVSLKELGFTEDIAETGSTLSENALIKARLIAERYQGSPVFSEDTGLEVMALGMAPGVYTARYAGDAKDAQANMDKLLREVQGKDRTARFRTVVALCWKDKEYLFEGWVNGKIAHEKSGGGGFGYDPVFIPYGHEKSFAELPAEIKNSISHRYRAMMRMKKFLSKQVK